MKRFTRLLQQCMLLLLSSLFIQQVNAQGCGCDFTINLNDSYLFNGTVKGVQPGDTICLANGLKTGSLEFVNLHGTRQQPIVITNACNSKSIITAGVDVFTINHSSFVHVTGSRPTNIQGDQYGIELTGGSMGMRIQQLSTDVEVDHVRIRDVGCCGIVAHTDPTCDTTTWRPYATMRNIKLHHNYVTNLNDCEGFYIGNSHWDYGRSGGPDDLNCTGVDTVWEQQVDTVEIYNNYIDGTGQDGIQVGGAINIKVYNNIVKHWAKKGRESHSHGIQMGSGATQALVYNNQLDSGGYCFTDQGGGGIWFNNVARDCKRGGIYMSDPNLNGGYAPTGFIFANNTLVNYGGYGIQMYDFNTATRSAVKNNILVGGPNQTNYFIFYAGTAARTDTARNYLTTNVANVKFVDSTAGNYHLQYNSPAVDKGVNTSSYGITTDIEANTRPQWNAYDIGAYEYAGTTPPSTDTVPPQTDTTTVTSKFNFSVSSQSTIPAPWISVYGQPHAAVLSGTDASSGFSVSSIATSQWPPATINGTVLSSLNGGSTVSGPVAPDVVVVTHWFNYNAPYGALVNNVVQGDNLALTGLRPNTTYTLKIGGSRRTNGAVAEQYGTMQYRFNGLNPQNLNVTNNNSREVTVTVTSDATGRIGISARKIADSSCNYGYLGWMVVTGLKANSGSRIVTAAPQEKATPSLLVYPNPAGNSAVLNLADFREQHIEVSILSAMGTLLQQRTFKGGKLHTINTSGLPNGLYFIQVQSGEKKITTRLFINK